MVKRNFMNYKLQIIDGGLIAIAGVQLALKLDSWIAFSLLFPISIGIGTGLVYSTVLFKAWKHFPGKEGVISGIIIAGFGLGGFIFTSATSYLMNPDGEEAALTDPLDITSKPFDHNISKRLPMALTTVSKMWALIILIVVVLLIIGEALKKKVEEDDYV